MNIWKKLLWSVLLAAGLAGAAHAEGVAWDKANVNTTDFDSLRHGAKIFVNYCLTCHSASFMRYNRLRDIGLTEQQIKDSLMFTTDKVGDTMKSAIAPVQAKAWFGVNPPDLSVIARAKAGEGGSGADYLYTLLRSFYRDPSRPTGWNNTTFANIGMPHPLWQLQGERAPVYETREVDGRQEQVLTGQWQQVTPGTLTAEQYDQTVRDLVNYLQWMGEPAQNTRVRIGVWVMLFLLLFTFIAWRLNAAYWKDVT